MPDFSAEEVLRQLGGRRFIAMTGANSFVKDKEKRSIVFKIPKGGNGINYVKITLNGSDTYDIEFIKMRSGNMTIVNTANDIYAEQLQEVFTENTGLYTHL
jgi:hypothetical protein